MFRTTHHIVECNMLLECKSRFDEQCTACVYPLPASTSIGITSSTAPYRFVVSSWCPIDVRPVFSMFSSDQCVTTILYLLLVKCLGTLSLRHTDWRMVANISALELSSAWRQCFHLMPYLLVRACAGDIQMDWFWFHKQKVLVFTRAPPVPVYLSICACSSIA